MRRPLHTALGLAAAAALTGLFACVGDDPLPLAPPAPDAASPDGATTEDGAAPGDAGADAADGSGRCDPKKAFAQVEVLPGVSTAAEESTVWVSPDELTAYVSDGDGNLKKSTRASPDLPFGAPADAPELANVNQAAGALSAPSLTQDGLVLAVALNATVQANSGAYVATRASVSEPFGPLAQARTRGAAIGAVGEPFLALDGLSLFVARAGDGQDLGSYPRDVAGTYGDGGKDFTSYAIGTTLDTLNTLDDERRPVVSKDLLTIVFASNRSPGSGANTDLYLATRAGPQGTFGAPVRLAEPVSSPNADRPGTLSPDGCVLYFTSDRPGGFGGSDVYVARRPK